MVFGLIVICISVITQLVCTRENKLAEQSKRQIIFDSNRSGNTEIYAINADGSGLQQLTHSGGEGRYSRLPDWSPDGKKVVFQSYREGDIEPGIYVMDANGTNIQRITPDNYQDESPAWSPDGKKIAFASTREGKDRIYMIDADGLNLKRVTQHDGDAFHPAWSPDGERLAFCSNVSNREGTWDIYTMKADGSDVQRLTHVTGERIANQGPAWSPDGKKIVFDSKLDGNFEIYMINIDGTSLKQLTQHEKIDARPCWSPDGKKITFHSTRDVTFEENKWNEFEIYVMDVDGTNIQRLTFNVKFDAHPDW